MIEDAPPSESRDSFGFTAHERDIIKTMSRSKTWRLMRDALCLEREKINSRAVDPDARNLAYQLGKKEGELAQVNRLLREGPYLAVYYDRYVREQEVARHGGEAEGPVDVPPVFRPPGEPPDME